MCDQSLFINELEDFWITGVTLAFMVAMFDQCGNVLNHDNLSAYCCS